VTVTFNDTELVDLTYELNDGELVNDVLCIVGEPDAEVLVRGYDAGSIAKYGRRSYRIDNPIVANVAALYATPKTQVTAILDRNIEPYALVQIAVMSKTDALTVKILGLEISDWSKLPSRPADWMRPILSWSPLTLQLIRLD
jgi:hypothetical protein